MLSYFSARSAASSLLMLLLHGCAEPPTQDAAAASATAAQLLAAADTALFAATVRAMHAEAISPLQVDPRPLRAGFDVDAAPNDDQLATIDPAVVNVRAKILDRLGTVRTNTIEDSRCAFVRGSPPPPDAGIPPGPAASAPLECLSRPGFSSVQFGLPEQGCKASGVDLSSPAECWTIHAVEITPSSLLFYELLARRSGTGSKWQVTVRNTGGAIA